MNANGIQMMQIYLRHLHEFVDLHYYFMQEEKNNDAQEIEVPTKYKKIVEEIENMSVLDLAELVKVLEKKFGVSASAPMMMAGVPAGSGGGEEGAAEEKTSFNVELKTAGDQKINVIKAVREIIGIGLKEAKDLVDGAPKTIKEGIKKEEADEIKQKLETVGATVEIK